MSLQILTSDSAPLLTPERWDSFVESHRRGHLLQATAWGTFKSRFAWQTVHVALVEGDRLVAGAQLLFRRVPGGRTLAYAPKGLLVDWEDEGQTQTLLTAIEGVASRHRAFALTIEPEMVDEPILVKRLRSLEFRPAPHAIQPRSTIWLDLTGEPDDWLARMKQKTRYNIRLAGRRGIAIREGREADLPAFFRLMRETAERDGFAHHSEEYYIEGFRVLVGGGMARLLLATYEERILAGLLVAAFGDNAWYLWGASSSEERQRMPNYLLQWEAMRWAKSQGCRAYDLWGIPDEAGRSPEAFSHTVAERRGGLWGVYRFKQGWGGEVVRYIGAWDKVYSPIWYRLYLLGLRLQKRRQQGDALGV